MVGRPSLHHVALTTVSVLWLLGAWCCAEPEPCDPCDDCPADDDCTGDDDSTADDDSAGDDDQPSVREGRGTWIHATEYGSDAAVALPAIEAHVADLVDLGLNLLIPVVKGSHAYYPSSVTGVAEGWGEYDFIAAFRAAVDQASPDGRVEFHPWTCVYRTGSLLEEHPEYASLSRFGTVDAGMACPARPEVRARAVAVAREILEEHPEVDGIHLDYVRYAELGFCVCDHCRAAFMDHHGEDPMDLADEDERWIEWRVAQITGLVEEVRAIADGFDPPKKVSAAVFNLDCPEDDRVRLGQHWKDWLDRGLIDFAAPMNYTMDMGFFAHRTDQAIKSNDPSRSIYIGIGLYQFEPEDNHRALSQIEIARILGAKGTVLFRSAYIDEAFAEGLGTLYPTPAVLPHAVAEGGRKSGGGGGGRR